MKTTGLFLATIALAFGIQSAAQAQMIGSPAPTVAPTTPTINPSSVVPTTVPNIVGAIGTSATQFATETRVPTVVPATTISANQGRTESSGIAVEDTAKNGAPAVLASPDAPPIVFVAPPGTISKATQGLRP